MVILTLSDRLAPLILVDSSAWIEFLRNTGSLPCLRLRELVRTENIAICDAVRMEVLAGARDQSNLRYLQRLLARTTPISTQSSDYENAAELYRRCRRQGETVRKLLDCLIAAVAIRAGIPVLHNDRDFDVLARHAELQIDRPES